MDNVQWEVKFEGLDQFCFTCGGIGHLREVCSGENEGGVGEDVRAAAAREAERTLEKEKGGIGTKVEKYGPWMLVEQKNRRPRPREFGAVNGGGKLPARGKEVAGGGGNGKGKGKMEVKNGLGYRNLGLGQKDGLRFGGSRFEILDEAWGEDGGQGLEMQAKGNGPVNEGSPRGGIDVNMGQASCSSSGPRLEESKEKGDGSKVGWAGIQPIVVNPDFITPIGKGQTYVIDSNSIGPPIAGLPRPYSPRSRSPARRNRAGSPSPQLNVATSHDLAVEAVMAPEKELERRRIVRQGDLEAESEGEPPDGAGKEGEMHGIPPLDRRRHTPARGAEPEADEVAGQNDDDGGVTLGNGKTETFMARCGGNPELNC